jgi:acetylglutamate kinase
MEATLAKIKTLSEALPYIRRYRGKTAVIKYGGNAMVADSLCAAFARDVALLKLVGINPVVVHGGGPQISETLARLGKQSRFVRGLRYTDAGTMEVVEMVLGGVINKSIVAAINACGGRAVGLTGKDGAFISARRIAAKDGGDLGRVGAVENINPSLLSLLDGADFIPVVAPIGVDRAGEALNINSDAVASRLALAVGAEVLLILTNTSGVLDKRGKLFPTLTIARTRRLMREGVISGGMLPKAECAVEAVRGGVPSCRIINGALEHSLLLEFFTDEGVGTQIVPK